MKIFKKNKENISITHPEDDFREIPDFRITEAFGVNTAHPFSQFYHSSS